MVVSNPLLNKTNLILFLNKIDIMKEKLANGVKFGRFITSYGDRPNDFEATSNCECLPSFFLDYLLPVSVLVNLLFSDILFL